MKFISKIKNIFKPLNRRNKLAAILFYTDKIVVQTFDYSKSRHGIGTTKLSIIATDSNPKVLGETLKRHLNLTEYDVNNQNDSKLHWEAFKKALQMSSDEDTYRDAKELICLENSNHIILQPTENLKNTGFEYLNGFEIRVPLSVSEHDLGLFIKEAYSKCIC